MSGYLNKAQLIGNLGADPESRTMQNGGLVVTLSVATSESWRDQASGERRTRTEWHRVVIFNEGLGRIADQYLTKGAKVYVEGMLRTRKWQDTEGHDRYSTEIHLTPYNGVLIFLDGRRDGDSAAATGASDGRCGVPGRTGGMSNLDDEIPFELGHCAAATVPPRNPPDTCGGPTGALANNRHPLGPIQRPLQGASQHWLSAT